MGRRALTLPLENEAATNVFARFRDNWMGPFYITWVNSPDKGTVIRHDVPRPGDIPRWIGEPELIAASRAGFLEEVA